LTTHPLAEQVAEARAVLRQRHVGAIARTACFNAASAAAAAVSGVIVARTVGPAVRGEYAAVISWFGVLLLLGELGQSAAVCYYVASDPRRARGYVATSRAMMMITGACALLVGLAVAPLLAHGNPQLTSAYRVVFGGSAIAFIGTGYTFSLQATSTQRWNLVRISQPALALAMIITARLLDQLTLGTAIGVMLASMAVQLGYAYYLCRQCGLAPGRVEASLISPLVKCGLAQFGAITPSALNSFLDQLVLSQLVRPADLGRYAIAVSVTTVPMPLVLAIGNVAFPRLAARQGNIGSGIRLALTAVAVAASIASAILLPLAASAYWLIPAVFGPAYRGAVPLLWILTPGGVFLACGQVVGDLLRGLGRPGQVAMAQGLTAVCAVILLVALLPVAGVMAAAVASTVGYAMALALMFRWLSEAPRPGKGRHRRRRWCGASGSAVKSAKRKGIHADRDRRAGLAGLVRGQHHRRAPGHGSPAGLGRVVALIARPVHQCGGRRGQERAARPRRTPATAHRARGARGRL
jgi:O-antigen/teichoic acid export membrane protein